MRSTDRIPHSESFRPGMKGSQPSSPVVESVGFNPTHRQRARRNSQEANEASRKNANASRNTANASRNTANASRNTANASRQTANVSRRTLAAERQARQTNHGIQNLITMKQASTRFMKTATDQIKKEVSGNNVIYNILSLQGTIRVDHAKRIHELLVQAQTEEHERPGTLFNLVIQGDLASIKDRLENERKLAEGSLHMDNMLVKKTDAAGGNVIHAAYLYQKYHIGRWLVENYPHIALEPYSNECAEWRDKFGINIKEEDMPYTGENILHMAIVRKNLAEVRWILDFYKGHKDSVPRGLETLLLGNAVGKFFARNGDFYCGSYPLHFAACSNTPQMFDLILSYASAINYSAVEQEENDNNNARDSNGDLLNSYDSYDNQRLGTSVIFMRDVHGNNCLHLAVVHRLQDMYAHIKKTALNLLGKEIRLAYADKLLSEDSDDRIFLRPLPNNEGFKFGYCPEETILISPAGRLSVEAHNGWVTAQTERKVEERMELVLNEDFHSPLTLCAASHRTKTNDVSEDKKKSDMIHFLIAQMKKERWSYGPVKCSLLILEGVEYPYYQDQYRRSSTKPLPLDAGNKMFGLIEWICITDSNQSAKIPEIQKIITAKWNRFGYAIFVKNFILRLFLTLLLTIILCFANATPTYTDYNPTGIELAVSILYPICMFVTLCISLYELPCFIRLGFDYWGFFSRRVRGAAKYEKISNTIIIFSFACVVANEYVRHVKEKQGLTISYQNDPGVKISFTACILAAWLYLYYFLMGFDSTGPFVLTIYRIVSRDVPFFVTFYLIVLIAFGCAISLLTSSGNMNPGYGFVHLIKTIFDLIQVTVTMQQRGSYAPEVDVASVPKNLIWIFNIIFTVFYIVVVLMFLNLLIAMINSTYGKLIEYDDALLLMEKYNIMCSMEGSLWSIDRRTLPQAYSVVVHSKTDINYNNLEDDEETESYGSDQSSVHNGDSADLLQKQLYSNSIRNMNANSSTGNISARNTMGNMSARNATTGNNDEVGARDTSCLRLTNMSISGRGFINGGGGNNNSMYNNGGLLGSYENYQLSPRDETRMSLTYDEKEREKEYQRKIMNQYQFIASDGGNNEYVNYAFEMLDEDKTWWGRKEKLKHNNGDLDQIKKKVILLLIMPQNDFHEGGSLAVPGSNADSKRIGDMIRKNMDNIDEIIVAMDSHYPTHIAHAIFWRRGWKNPDPYNVNQHPDPFTVITHKDIIEEIWTPVQTDEFLIEWCKYYTKELEKKGRLQLTIWPQHCIIGSNGHAIIPSINDAIQQWATYRARSIKYEMKGKNLYTEMYSVLAAEVEDPTDPATGMDWDLLAELKIADKVLVCGQALSHCVNFTFMDILKHWHSEPAKLHLLKNGCSSVAGFEQVGEHFLDTIAKQGVSVLNCEDVEF